MYMRSLAVWSAFVIGAFGIVACGGGGGSGTAGSVYPTVTPMPAPGATTSAQSVTLPAAPSGTGTVAVSLPAPGGITPALILGSGYAAGTQIFVDAANYGQTSSVKRSPASTFASCPVLIDLTAYVTLPLPTSALQGFSVAFGSALTFLGSGTFSAEIYDAGATQTTGTPPVPGQTNGCATAPATTSVLATATGSVASGVVTFANFASNPSLSSALQTEYGLGNGGSSGSIPAGAVFGFYITFVAGATPAPSASATASPSPTSSATVTPTASPTATPTQSTTLATATLLGSAGFINTNGRTVYVLSDDTVSSIACTVSSGCTGVWPPVSPPAGVTLTTGFTAFARADLGGAMQLAFNNHPLYEYAGDSSAGQTNGNGLNSFGGTWSVGRP